MSTAQASRCAGVGSASRARVNPGPADLTGVPVSVPDRWIACLRRRADAQVKRANLAAMQHGLLPAGWVYGRNDQCQAEYEEQRRILLERHRHLYREPVCGPDGVAVALWYAGAGEYPAPLLVPGRQWPGLPAADEDVPVR